MGTKADALTAFVSALTAGQAQAINDAGSALYDQAIADNPPGSGGGFQQSDIDAAVAAAVGPLNNQIATLTAQDASDIAAGQQAVVGVQQQLSDLQSKFDALATKEAGEASAASVVPQYIAALQQLQAVVATLQSLGLPVIPVPVDPTPVNPTPVDPVPVDPTPVASFKKSQVKPSGLR